ncbi:MAG: hypothetical protein GX941_07215, partial [Candidatus Methanofastidiosa archaeon]|nr:hypothetical protein [Candidatus Methanofastidiosa archaeon]
WSDDTSMTLCILDSLSNGLDYEDIMTKFLAWFNKGEYTPFGQAFDIGNGTRKALMYFEKGTPALECGGSTERDNGNGSLMRILPLAFYLRNIYGEEFTKKEEAFEIIHNISALTHAHKRSKIACGIYISIASEILEKIDLKGAIESGTYKAMEYYKEQDDFKKELKNYERLENKDFQKTNIDKIKSSGYVVHTIEAAIWCLLNTTNYKDCVLKAVNLGEDTDTVGAIAGGCKRQVLFHKNRQLIFHNKWQLVFHTYLLDLSHGLFRGILCFLQLLGLNHLLLTQFFVCTFSLNKIHYTTVFKAIAISITIWIIAVSNPLAYCYFFLWRHWFFLLIVR